MNDDESLEIQRLVQKYETSKREGTVCYLDSDDFADIAEYYINDGRADSALEVINDSLNIHKDDEYLLSLKVNALINLHYFEEALSLLPSINPETDHDYYFFQAQLTCAIEHENQKANEWFEKWIKIEKAECDKIKNTLEGNTRYREAFMHIILSIVDLNEEESDEDDYDSEDNGIDLLPFIQPWVDKYVKECSPLPADDIDLDIARACHDADMLSQEIRLYNLFLDSNPYLPQGWTYLASLQSMAGDIDAAVNSAEFAIAIDSNDVQAWMVKSLGDYSLDNDKEAIKSLRRYIDLSGDEYYYTMLGTCLMREGQKEEACNCLEKASKYVTLKVKDKVLKANARAVISNAYTIGGYSKKALRSINLAIRSNPDSVEYLVQKSLILIDDNKTENALKALFDLIAMVCRNGNENCSSAFMNMADKLLNKEHVESAVLLYTLVSQDIANPDHAKAYVRLAHCYYLLHEHKNFFKYLELACKNAPDAVGKFWEEELIGIDPENYYPTLRAMYKKFK